MQLAQPRKQHAKVILLPQPTPVDQRRQNLVYASEKPRSHSLASISEQTAMLAHDMRSPLSVILNVLHSCQQLSLSQIDQQRLSLALEEAERLQRLTSEILDYARCTCEPTLRWEKIRCRDLINEVVYLTAELPVGQDRRIVVTPNLPDVLLRGDRDKLKQALLNLLVNACEAIHSGQVVRVCCDLAPNMTQVTVQIHNGGQPIPPHLLPILSYQRLTTKSQGNGLGLMMVRQIVAAHAGEFFIESSELYGTTTWVQLPVM